MRRRSRSSSGSSPAGAQRVGPDLDDDAAEARVRERRAHAAQDRELGALRGDAGEVDLGAASVGDLVDRRHGHRDAGAVLDAGDRAVVAAVARRDPEARRPDALADRRVDRHHVAPPAVPRVEGEDLLVARLGLDREDGAVGPRDLAHVDRDEADARADVHGGHARRHAGADHGEHRRVPAAAEELGARRAPAQEVDAERGAAHLEVGAVGARAEPLGREPQRGDAGREPVAGGGRDPLHDAEPPAARDPYPPGQRVPGLDQRSRGERGGHPGPSGGRDLHDAGSLPGDAPVCSPPVSPARRFGPVVLFACAILAMSGPWASYQATSDVAEPWFELPGALAGGGRARPQGHPQAGPLHRVRCVRLGRLPGLPRRRPRLSPARGPRLDPRAGPRRDRREPPVAFVPARGVRVGHPARRGRRRHRARRGGRAGSRAAAGRRPTAAETSPGG